MNPNSWQTPLAESNKAGGSVQNCRRTALGERLLLLHRDEQGSISILSLFALLVLVMLMGMVMNTGRQIDSKIKMQNASDAGSLAGGVVLARNMNTLAFTNHLLCDVFALTAFMREAQTQSSRSLTPDILANWGRVGPEFIGAEFPKFDALGQAIVEKTPHEETLIVAFSDWSAAASELMLPVLEEILSERAIPEFQRTLNNSTPEMVQTAIDQTVRRHAQSWPRSTIARGVLWRTNGLTEAERRMLPVVDPVEDVVPNQQAYLDDAREQRSRLAHRYLSDWNAESLLPFDEYGKFSQFANLWRIFTCGELERLLNEEYPATNMPMQIRAKVQNITNVYDHLEADFMFVGVAYREPLGRHMPGVFKNPISTSSQAYAQIMLFVPKRRLQKGWRGLAEQQQAMIDAINLGGVPGQSVSLPTPPRPQLPPNVNPDEEEYFIYRQNAAYYPEQWDLLNQNWSTQLVPASTRNLPEILSALPAEDANTPNFRNLDSSDVQWISHH